MTAGHAVALGLGLDDGLPGRPSCRADVVDHHHRRPFRTLVAFQVAPGPVALGPLADDERGNRVESGPVGEAHRRDGADDGIGAQAEAADGGRRNLPPPKLLQDQQRREVGSLGLQGGLLQVQVIVAPAARSEPETAHLQATAQQDLLQALPAFHGRRGTWATHGVPSPKNWLSMDRRGTPCGCPLRVSDLSSATTCFLKDRVYMHLLP